MTEPLILTLPDADEHIPDGLRLSTDCPCRRLREFRVPDEYPKFPVELQTRGYLGEMAFEQCFLHDTHHAHQIVVPWEHGESHLDFVALTGPKKKLGVHEIKVNADGALTEENIRQVQRQRFVVERAVANGLPIRSKDGEVIDGEAMLALPWRIFVLHPSLPIILSPDGHSVSLTDARRDAIAAEWEAQDDHMQRIDKLDPYWPDDWPECTCHKCWPAPKAELAFKLQDTARFYLDASDEIKELEQRKKELGADLVAALGGEGKPYEGGGVRVTVVPGRTGERIDYRKGFMALGADATEADLRAGGYVVATETAAHVRVNRVAVKLR